MTTTPAVDFLTSPNLNGAKCVIRHEGERFGLYVLGDEQPIAFCNTSKPLADYAWRAGAQEVAKPYDGRLDP